MFLFLKKSSTVKYCEHHVPEMWEIFVTYQKSQSMIFRGLISEASRASYQLHSRLFSTVRALCSRCFKLCCFVGIDCRFVVQERPDCSQLQKHPKTKLHTYIHCNEVKVSRNYSNNWNNNSTKQGERVKRNKREKDSSSLTNEKNANSKRNINAPFKMKAYNSKIKTEPERKDQEQSNCRQNLGTNRTSNGDNVHSRDSIMLLYPLLGTSYNIL